MRRWPCAGGRAHAIVHVQPQCNLQPLSPTLARTWLDHVHTCRTHPVTIRTSPNKSHYQAITAHFVDKLGRLQKATLALREHKDSHGANEQEQIFFEVLQEYEINEEKLGYITGRH